MVMASLAWTLKAWFALLLPETGRWGQKYQAEKQTVLRMEFKTFLNAFMLVPCQLVRTGRRIVFRLMAWNRGCQSCFVPWMCCVNRCDADRIMDLSPGGRGPGFFQPFKQTRRGGN